MRGKLTLLAGVCASAFAVPAYAQDAEEDTASTDMIRATAVNYMGEIASEESLNAIKKFLRDTSAMVRNQAVTSLANFPSHLWIGDAQPLLKDPVRGVRIAAAAARRNLPLAITGGPGRALTVAGALFSYCASYDEILRRTADYVDRILRGARPAEMPVELTMRYDFILNLQTARAIGLRVSKGVLLLADEVIE